MYPHIAAYTACTRYLLQHIPTAYTAAYHTAASAYCILWDLYKAPPFKNDAFDTVFIFNLLNFTLLLYAALLDVSIHSKHLLTSIHSKSEQIGGVNS